MNLNGAPILSIVIFLPLAGIIPLIFFDRSQVLLIRTWSLLIAIATFVVSLGLALGFNPAQSGPQFVERTPWVSALGIQYFLGIDGISLVLILLTTFLTVIAILASWLAMDHRQAKNYAIFVLLLETGVAGTFAALDLILFFAFWEAMLVPAYLICGVCGGPRRIYAAYKFVLYTAVGSLLMLVAIIALYFIHAQLPGQQPTFDLVTLVRTPVPAGLQTWLFLGFALAFAIKIPIWPLHTWLPDLYTESPLGAMVLITTMAKVGAYGMLRFAIPLFPSAAAAYAPLLAVLGLVGIIYGGLSAYQQRDLVRVIAYSSIAHLGFIVLGIFSLNHQSVEGAVVQMVNHGISAAALFLVAAVIYARTRSTSFDSLGGLASRWPVLAAFALIGLLSSVGLPGLNGFVGEFLIIFGAFQTNWIYAAIAAVGIVIAAVYLLAMYRRVFHGPAGGWTGIPDLRGREVLAFVPLVILIVGIGLYPGPLLNTLDRSVTAVTAPVHVASQGAPLSHSALAIATRGGE